MLLSPELAWIELVVMGSVAVFVADLIGNKISFQNRFTNALTTATIFAVAFALLINSYGTVMLMDWGFAVVQPSP